MGTARTVRAGVIGTGALGSHHARVYSSIESVSSLALYDRDRSRAEAVARERGGRVCGTIGELLDSCDAVSICTPATHHHEAVRAAFARGAHVLVEKPIASTVAEARDLVAISRERGLVFQVGHIERFNGAFEAARSLVRRPRFIEAHRLATFTQRGLDVSVVQDLMIHDIDLILSLLGGDRLVDLRASGAGVLTSASDIVNARLEFAGGCTANVTASRISREPLRKIRFFEEHRYVSADLREKSVEAYELAGPFVPGSVPADPASLIRPVAVAVDMTEPLRKEIDAFLAAISGGGEPPVTGEAGLAALDVAEKILERVAESRSRQ
jgi:predicted dehydrogenase